MFTQLERQDEAILPHKDSHSLQLELTGLDPSIAKLPVHKPPSLILAHRNNQTPVVVKPQTHHISSATPLPASAFLTWARPALDMV
jgi:hypothetical protein